MDLLRRQASPNFLDLSPTSNEHPGLCITMRSANARYSADPDVSSLVLRLRSWSRVNLIRTYYAAVSPKVACRTARWHCRVACRSDRHRGLLHARCGARRDSRRSLAPGGERGTRLWARVVPCLAAPIDHRARADVKACVGVDGALGRWSRSLADSDTPSCSALGQLRLAGGHGGYAC